MIVTIAMGCARKLGRDSFHESVLFVRQPQLNRLVQPSCPILGLRKQPTHFRRVTRQERFAKPHSFTHQLTDNVEGLVSFFWLQAIDAQNEEVHVLVILGQQSTILLPGRHHVLITPQVNFDSVGGYRDLVALSQLRAELRHRPMVGKTPMSKPAKHIPAEEPAR